MAIQGIAGAGLGSVTSAPQPGGGEKFGKVFKGQTRPAAAAPRGETSPLEARPGQIQARSRPPPTRLAPAQATRALEPAKMIDQVAAAQKRMEAVLELAQSGKSFTPAELLSLQSQMYRASQELDLAGKVVEKATGGVKQILQTQV